MQQAGAMLQASLLSMPGIRHAFFTREGGVSDGFYQSLNAGLSSRDVPERVAENRARMAAALGVAPDRLVTAYQIHSPDVVVATEPWTRAQAPRADAVVTRVHRSEEHTSELQSRFGISYAVFCLKK